jgi:hypothetical protein
VIEAIAKQNPSRRLGEPDDVAPLVGFLASQAAQWINGQNIRVNGVGISFLCYGIFSDLLFFREGIRCLIKCRARTSFRLRRLDRFLFLNSC